MGETVIQKHTNAGINFGWIATDNLDTSEPLIILVFIFCRWHLIAVNHADAYCYKTFRCNQNIAAGFFPRSVDLFLSVRVSNNWKSFLQPHYHGSYRDGSCCPPVPWFQERLPSWLCVLDRLIRNEPAPVLGITPPYSHQQCVQDNVLVIRDCMDQPIILRENRSTTTARYSQPSWVLSE